MNCKKMKLISCMVLVACSTGCGNPTDEYACYKSVQKKFPISDIEKIPNYWMFVVRDSTGAIWLAKTDNLTNAEISETIKLLDGNGWRKSN